MKLAIDMTTFVLYFLYFFGLSMTFKSRLIDDLHKLLYEPFFSLIQKNSKNLLRLLTYLFEI